MCSNGVKMANKQNKELKKFLKGLERKNTVSKTGNSNIGVVRELLGTDSGEVVSGSFRLCELHNFVEEITGNKLSGVEKRQINNTMRESLSYKQYKTNRASYEFQRTDS